jgi:putative FmdB family regulatory protein
MPTYDYKCTNCNYTFEYFQPMSAEPLKECPNCKKEFLKRIIGTGAGPIFKGSGFYQTDYKNQSIKKNNDPKMENKPAPSEKKENKVDKK